MPSDAPPAPPPGVTAALASHVAQISFEGLPAAVIERARALLLDHVGCIIRARHSAECAPSMLAAARALGLAAGGGGVFGDAARYTPAGSAFLNAALARALDLDDVHPGARLHPGAAVIPAAFAAAEMAGARGSDLLAAIVAGYDVACRLSLALPTAAHRARGFHPTATCGVFGAAAAAARVFGLDAAGASAALATATGAAGGTLHFLSGGGWTGVFQVGWAAMGGLAAATLAREGFAGSAASLEGEHGFLSAFSPAPELPRALEGLGDRFELMNVQTKSRAGAVETRPASSAEAGEKFREMVEPILGARRAAHLQDSLLGIERTVDVAALPRLAAPLMSVRLERPGDGRAGGPARTWPTGRRRRS
jgi:2-methylcitrate dehydratase PrpD